MRIAIDGTTLLARDGSPGAGIEEYTRRLSAAMVAAAPEDVRAVTPLGRVPFFSRHVSVPMRASVAKADVLFCPSGHIPLGWFGKSVITVHDLAIYEHPEWFPKNGSPLDARSILRADRIVAVSEATKAQIGRLFPEAVEKTTVVYPGVSVFEGARGRTTVSTKDTVLFVGTLEPRKNLLNAILAFDAFLRMHPDRATTTRFVLAGKTGWKSDAILAAVTRVNETWRARAGEDVAVLTGYVTEEEKWALYRSSTCLFFPSFYEGFGLPVLEAMAAGLPVVTSARGALPEVGGDAVMYVDPEDVEQMAFALAQCVMLPDAMRDIVAEAGRRSRTFAWSRCAEGVLQQVAAVA